MHIAILLCLSLFFGGVLKEMRQPPAAPPRTFISPNPKEIYLHEVFIEDKILKSKVERILKEIDSKTKIIYRKGYAPMTISHNWNEVTFTGSKIAVAYVSPQRCDIVLSKREDWSDDYYLKTTLIHEIGHCFGYLHSDSYRSVMFPYHITTLLEADIQRFITLLGNIGFRGYEQVTTKPLDLMPPMLNQPY